MGDNYEHTIGDVLFANIDSNEYLNELYESILYNYSVKLFGIKEARIQEINVGDALRFADILSKSTNPEKADLHKIWAQEIVALLQNLYPQNPMIEYYLGSVLTNTGNFYGMKNVVPKYKELSLLDEAFANYSKEYMRIPAEPDKQFLQSQKRVYDRLGESCLSYSGPT